MQIYTEIENKPLIFKFQYTDKKEDFFTVYITLTILQTHKDSSIFENTEFITLTKLLTIFNFQYYKVPAFW